MDYDSITFYFKYCTYHSDLLLAAVFVAVLVSDKFRVLALFILTICVIAKLFYESLETIDPGPMEAMTAVGANKTKWIMFGVVPQTMSTFYHMYYLHLRLIFVPQQFLD